MRCATALAILISCVAAAATPASDPVRLVLEVAPDGSAAFTSVQAALDAAPNYAVIRIAAGTYDGPLRITKPVTLEGAGWDQTHLRGHWFDLQEIVAGEEGVPPEKKERLAELVKRLGMTDGEAYGKVLEQLLEEFGPSRLLEIEGAPNVALKGLRFSYLGNVRGGGFTGAHMALVANSTVTVDACAFVGSAVFGLRIQNAADVKFDHCLFAGIRATALDVDIPTTARVALNQCEIRNCGYAGVQVKGDGQVDIEHCRFATIEFHAVRYDDASPKLVGNVFLDVNRGGVYTDGESRAILRNNLFLGCAFSARGSNRDLLEDNTFVYARARKGGAWSDETAVWINAPGTPVLRRNVFCRFAHGVVTSADAAQPVLEGNVFDTGASPFVRCVSRQADGKNAFQELPLPAGNAQRAVRFVNESKDDFAIGNAVFPPGTSAGAHDFRSPASNWPEAAEERALLDRVIKAESKDR